MPQKTNYLFEQKTWYSEGSKDDMKAHLVDKHDGENCLIQEFCFAEKEKNGSLISFFIKFFFLFQNIL